MNEFGRLFRITIFGESHQKNVGIVIDGIPAGIKLDKDDFLPDLEKRKSGSLGTTKRIEEDIPNIISGLYNGFTDGSPLTILFDNNNIKSKDYDKLRDIPRPSHSDFVFNKKFNGYNDIRGGGYSSGRLTLPLTAAGVVAKKIVSHIKIESEIINLAGDTNKDHFDEILNNAINEGNSVGGIINLKATNVDISLGEPYFDSFESVLSHLLFSIGGVKGVEYGIGFKGVNLKGSEFNDPFINKNGKTLTNNSGGINAGVTNGNDISVNIFIKPTSSIFKMQNTFNFKKEKMDELKIEGRHDVAIIRRASVVCEAALAITLADFYLINKAYK